MRKVVQLLHHLVGGGHHARVRFIGALRQDHLHELLDNIDIRLLENSLLQAAQALRAARRTDDGVARSRGRQINVLANAVQPAGILEECQLDGSHLLRLRLPWLRNCDRAIGADGDGERVRRNGDRRIERIAVGRHHVSLVVEMKHSCPRVPGLAARHLHLKKTCSLDGQVKWITGGVEVALGLYNLRRSSARAQPDLQPRGDGGVLRCRRSRHDQVLVNQILKLQSPAAKARGARVRQVVGNVVEVELLGCHAGGRSVKSAQHEPQIRDSSCAAMRLKLEWKAVSACCSMSAWRWRETSPTAAVTGLTLLPSSEPCTILAVLASGFTPSAEK